MGHEGFRMTSSFKRLSVIIFAALLLCLMAFHARAAGGEEEEESKPLGGYLYVEFDPLNLPIVDDSGVSQVINVVIAIEVKSVKAANKIRALQPKFTDAFITDMYGILNRHAALKGGVLQVKMIKERLNKIAKNIAGEDDIVHDVMLQFIQQRPI